MFNIPTDIVWILIAIFGGIARYLDTFLKEKEEFSLMKMVATIFICGFSGYMAAQFTLLLYPAWALIAAGIGGYAGVEALNFILNIWKSKFTIQQDSKKDDNKK